MDVVLKNLMLLAKEVAEEPSQVVEFKPTAGFRPYRRFFVKESVKHPAKANLHMIRWIIEKWTQEGETILDPMAGTYSTCIMASLLNRNSIGVEYEQKFYEMGKKNVEKMNKKPSLTPRGKIVVLKGDARQLGTVLKENVDKILFSPPYAESVNAPSDPERRAERLRRAGYNPEQYQGGQARCLQMKRQYSKDKQNIGSMPYGDIDAIITSPPYAHGSTAAPKDKYTGHGKEVPYTEEEYMSWETRKGGNIGKKKLFKRVPCPKEEADRHDTRPERKGTPWEWTKEVKVDVKDIEWEEKKADRSESYLSAMLKVYCECFQVLKPDGLMILITKNFIRKKKIVRLDLDTIKLCRAAGFAFIDRWYRKLTHFSFWVINYYKKYGLRVEYEDILVFQKRTKGNGKIDAVITSPPYASTYLGGGDEEARKKRLLKAGYDPKDYLGGTARCTVRKHYTEE